MEFHVVLIIYQRFPKAVSIFSMWLIHLILIVNPYTYIYILYISTIWLFNIAMEAISICKNGKPSISMGHFHQFSMAMLVITRGYI